MLNFDKFENDDEEIKICKKKMKMIINVNKKNKLC
jgi:hypothetical protein